MTQSILSMLESCLPIVFTISTDFGWKPPRHSIGIGIKRIFSFKGFRASRENSSIQLSSSFMLPWKQATKMLKTWQPWLNVPSITSMSKAKPDLAVVMLNFLGSYLLLASWLGWCYINAPNPLERCACTQNLTVVMLNFLGNYLLLASWLGRCYINAPNPFTIRKSWVAKFEGLFNNLKHDQSTQKWS